VARRSSTRARSSGSRTLTCRARAAGHGWGATPWLPFPPDAGERSVEALRADRHSILHLYHLLLVLRRSSPALTAGSCRLLDARDGVLAYERVSGADRHVVLVNFTDGPVAAPVPGVVEVTSDGGAYQGTLAPLQAVVLRP
jgi:alpha-glucosidase